MSVGVSNDSGSKGPERKLGEGTARVESSATSHSQTLITQPAENQNTELTSASITSSATNNTFRPSLLKVALLSDIPYSAVGVTILSGVITASLPLSLYTIPLVLIALSYPALAIKTVINEHKALNRNVAEKKDDASRIKEIDKPSLFRSYQALIHTGQALVLLAPAVFALSFSAVPAISYYDVTYLMLSAIGCSAAGRSANEHARIQASLVKKENSLFDTFKILFYTNPGASWLLADTMMGIRVVLEVGLKSLSSNTFALGFLVASVIPTLLGSRSVYKQITETQGDKINTQRIYACAIGAVHAACFAAFNFSIGKPFVGVATSFFVASLILTGRKIYLSSRDCSLKHIF